MSARKFKKTLLLLLAFKLALFFFLVTRSDISNFSGINFFQGRWLPKLKSFNGNFLFDLLPGSTRKNKSILIWNSPDRIEVAAFGMGYESFVHGNCEVSSCVIYENHSALPLNEYDAIVVNMHELWITKLPDFNRSQQQRFIFLTQESPATMFLDVEAMANVFNWTMSYRLNSDIPLLYGRIRPGPTAPTSPEAIQHLIDRMHIISDRNYATNKTDLVAWMVSNCKTDSLRETYVRQLNKSIQVDVYGNCGTLSCPKNDSHWLSYPECYNMLEKKYKFYLSFENSVCNDYVTEKFFEIANHDMVPIVYGGANYSEIAPPHSYINALDYTPEKLAEYLKMLDANDTLYNEYFWWKEYFTVESGVYQMARHGFCDLCKKLHDDEGSVKYYSELVSQWQYDVVCHSFTSWE